MNSISRQVTDQELRGVNKRHAIVAWCAAVGIGLLSSAAVVMSATGMGF
jgi:hypothetical protein